MCSILGSIGCTGAGGGNTESTYQSNAYIELGTNSTDFISGSQFFGNTGQAFDNGYIAQSYLLS